MAGFVLVHGAWLGGWSFEPLAAELEARGHCAESPDLPCEDGTKTVSDYAALLGDCRDTVVVAHSLGGLSAALVEARAHVYLTALLPCEGIYREALSETFTGSVSDDEGRSYWPDIDTAAANLFRDCSREQAEWAFPKLRHQAPVEYVPAPLSGVYVACLQDHVIRPEWQLGAAERGLRVVELDAGHFPMLTHARELAGILDSISRGTPS